MNFVGVLVLVFLNKIDVNGIIFGTQCLDQETCIFNTTIMEFSKIRKNLAAFYDEFEIFFDIKFNDSAGDILLLTNSKFSIFTIKLLADSTSMYHRLNITYLNNSWIITKLLKGCYHSINISQYFVSKHYDFTIAVNQSMKNYTKFTQKTVNFNISVQIGFCHDVSIRKLRIGSNLIVSTTPRLSTLTLTKSITTITHPFTTQKLFSTSTTLRLSTLNLTKAITTIAHLLSTQNLFSTSTTPRLSALTLTKSISTWDHLLFSQKPFSTSTTPRLSTLTLTKSINTMDHPLTTQTPFSNSIFIDLINGNTSTNLISWGEWSAWSSCNDSYGKGFMNRFRYCNVSNECCSANYLDVKECYDSIVFDEIAGFTNTSLNFFYEEFVVSFEIFINKSGYFLSLDNNVMSFYSWENTFIVAVLLNDEIFIRNISISKYTWNAIKVSQLFNENDNTFITAIVVNGTVLTSAINSQPKVFIDVNVTTFFNCYNVSECFYATIKNLSIYSKKKAYWSHWSNWSHCNISYGIGIMNRTRKCNVLNSVKQCSGKNIEINNCCFSETFTGNIDEVIKCCLNETFKVSWMLWGDWSNCNISYGHGFMTRTRKCNSMFNAIECCSGNNIEIQDCFEWSTWSECSVTCGDGVRSRSFINMLMNRVIEPCNIVSCPVDGMWSDWKNSSCSTTCDYGITAFSRNCDHPSPTHNGKTCIGISNYTDECNSNAICPVNGFWSEWSEWSLCNQPCEGGAMSKFRSCSKPSPKYGGSPCYGNSTETTACLWKSCRRINLNLEVLFLDEIYQQDYSNLYYPTSLNLKGHIEKSRWLSLISIFNNIIQHETCFFRIIQLIFNIQDKM
ncbi:uncharacterized protein LOC100203479 isoform X3 [Hydra vulgaris]|uniref:uncharacterized protein LOC100203479 isoform X3 n=1 Tax=Hydra vulgaris TaxID=6087 RepID=UPI001F5F9B15|nr:uncharacterized protein LOC100203479 isoform X3 [Hydra vulgaris]